MRQITKLAIMALGAFPAFAGAQMYLYIPDQQDHFDIDNISGGGPFTGYIENSSHSIIGKQTFYCDSVPQEFSLGQTFAVQLQVFNNTNNMSLDPWVITQASAEAGLYDAANHVTLSDKQIVSAVQGVIWNLDGQITSGTMTSNDSGTAGFANYLLGAAKTDGKFVSGYARYSCDANYSDPTNPGHQVFGQSQIGAVPEPSAIMALGLPLAGMAFRKRRKTVA